MSVTVTFSASIDRLSALLERFRVRAALFHTGELCGINRFEERPGRAFLHVLRRGEMEVRHFSRGKVHSSLRMTEPALLFYPRPLYHEFVNPPTEGSDFTCATLDFDGGDRNPIVQSLPPFIHVPLSAIEGLEPALDLLFSEADRVRCGSRLLANRLFEVVLIQLLRWIMDHPDDVGVTPGLVMGLADPRLAKCLVALHQHPEEAWSLARMASVSGMSRSAFAIAFRETVGVTPASYLNDWRFCLAMAMLNAGQPLKRIATELGFSGVSSFSKAFRKRLGMSPSEWGARGQEGG